MYFIHVMSLETNKEWTEKFESYYKFRKRYYRLKYSRKMIILSHSLIGENN